MADETPIQVLKEEGRRPQSKSYVWLVRTGDNGGIPIILYNYTPTRAGSHAAAFLAGADPGYYLMVDGYKGYNKVPEAQRCCCWAHIRRYWHPESGDRLIKAINYSNGCRPFMMNYLKDGACSLSNNLSENSIRPLVVGRKNWLFCDTPAGADASMKIYSMIETAKANELDPLKYLSFLLEHRPGAEMSEETCK